MIRNLMLTALGALATSASSPPETVRPAFNQPLPNVAGKSLIAVIVDYPPGGASKPHRHARSSFIMAYVLSGHIRSAINGEPARVYGPGDSWSERPGDHHVMSANASSTEPAKLLAVFVVDTKDRALVIPDQGTNP